MMKKMLLVIPVFLVAVVAIAQSRLGMEVNKLTGREFLPASPTTASLTAATQNGVNYFNGTPAINIPVLDISYKDLKINMSLLYQNAAGVRPDNIPGSTGNGWELTMGGAVTRISKAVRPVDVPDPITVPANLNATAAADWSSDTKMNGYLATRTMFVDQGCRYDEYAFSFCGYSGKMYTDHTGAHKFRTLQGEEMLVTMDVVETKEFVLPEEPQGPYSLFSLNLDKATHTYKTMQHNLVYKFTFTDSKGIQYIFGGVDNAIEFSRPGMDFNQYDLRDVYILPVTWYLTSIISPNGYQIDLQYKRGQFYVNSTAFYRGRFITFKGVYAGYGDIPTAKSISSTLINPVYLDKIITPVSSTQVYWTTASSQLPYFVIAPNPPYSTVFDAPDKESKYYFSHYPDVDNADMTNRFAKKIDSIVVSVNDTRVKKASFLYNNNPGERLRLDAVSINSIINNSTKASRYQFAYNNTPLPGYMSFHTDLFGYYNGSSGLLNSTNPSDFVTFFTTTSTRDAYVATRAVNPTYTKAEILEKVTYPTGGYTQFQYENNTYGRSVDSWPVTVTDNSGGTSLLTGGLRIKKITNYDRPGHKAGEKEFFYVRDYVNGDNISSGVSSFLPQIYYEFIGNVTDPANYTGPAPGPWTGSLVYKEWSTDPLNQPNYNNAAYIGYSAVTEKNADGGFKVMKFKNHDNGFANRPAEKMVCDNSNVWPFWKQDDENNMDLERGQLTEEHIYDDGNNEKVKTTYLYNDDVSRFDDNVRVIKVVPNNFASANYFSLRYTASLIYTYFPFLESTITQTFESSTSMTKQTNYTYNGSRLVTKMETSNSSGETETAIQRYPADMIVAGTTVPYQSMQNKHIISPIIENEFQIDGTKLTKKTTEYATGLSSNTDLLLPSYLKTQYKSSTTENRLQYKQYDGAGNLVSMQQPSGMNICIVYSYKQSLPIARIENADYSSVVTALGGQAAVDDFAGKIPTETEVYSFVDALYTNPLLSDAHVQSSAHLPTVGMISQQDMNRKKTKYEYDGLGRLSIIRDNDNNIVKVICYDYAGQQGNCIEDPGYLERQFIRTSTSAQQCNYHETQITAQVAHVYGKPAMPEDVGIPLSNESEFYYDDQFTNPIATGFYSRYSVSSGGNITLIGPYFYVEDGKVMYYNYCGNVDPYVVTYAETMPASNNLCAETYPTKYIFTLLNGAIGVGQSMYRDPDLNQAVEDGYYGYDGNFYEVKNGIVVSLITCPGSGPASLVLKRNPKIKNVCAALSLFTYTVYYPSAIAVGSVLYTDASMTMTLGTGYYSEGSVVYTVDGSGVVTSIKTCGEVASLPPFAVPPDIP